MPEEIKEIFRKKQIEGKIRQQQQGLGKPVISHNINGYQFVAVGSKLFASPNFKTFADFLHFFMIKVFSEEWFTKQLQLPKEIRHPLALWHEKVVEAQNLNSKTQTDSYVYSIPMNGACYCYLGVAYGLYLLNHNVELQKLFIVRLKDINNFQGAYYELIIANCLIRSGFKLELEDETDDTQKHCEFYAVSETTGKKYFIEAKMRSVRDMLGKTKLNGTAVGNPSAHITKHLNLALKKPSTSERMIFVDINSPELAANAKNWIEKAANRLERKEADTPKDVTAYVFVTNINFHWHLDSVESHIVVFAHGLGIDDFAKPGNIRLIDFYKQKQKHKDANNVFDSFKSYPQIPSTFDGSLPSEAFSKKDKSIKVGERYFFEDVKPNGLEATVTSATVDLTRKTMLIGTDKGHIISRPMSDDEIMDYKNHNDLIFGMSQPIKQYF